MSPRLILFRGLIAGLCAAVVGAGALVGRPGVAQAVPPTDLVSVQQHLIARFTTPIFSVDSGRFQNLAMAVHRIDGVALKTGQVFSFNGVVGPRDAEHGWARASELYQGEYVLGYGGGICQVTSTLYNAILLAGLEVMERYHHDRPLQYVEPGRDATVVYNVLDFRFRNNTDRAVLVGARITPGDPQQIEVSLYAPSPIRHDAISLETGDVDYFPPTLEEVPDASLPAGARQVIDEGQYGIAVETYRVFHHGGKKQRQLLSRDHYKPKAGKVKVGVGNQ